MLLDSCYVSSHGGGSLMNRGIVRDRRFLRLAQRQDQPSRNGPAHRGLFAHVTAAFAALAAHEVAGVGSLVLNLPSRRDFHALFDPFVGFHLGHWFNPRLFAFRSSKSCIVTVRPEQATAL